MAFLLTKPKTASTPYVLIDEAQGYMKLEGRSFHENVIDFFKEVEEWLDNYLATDFGSLTFDCELEYFNSSTAKLLLNLFTKMDSCKDAGKRITVNWIAEKTNDIIIEYSENFKEYIKNLQFNLVIM